LVRVGGSMIVEYIIITSVLYIVVSIIVAL